MCLSSWCLYPLKIPGIRKLSYGYELSQLSYERREALTKPQVPSYISLVTKAFTSPVMIGLFVAASTRQELAKCIQQNWI